MLAIALILLGGLSFGLSTAMFGLFYRIDSLVHWGACILLGSAIVAIISAIESAGKKKPKVGEE